MNEELIERLKQEIESAKKNDSDICTFLINEVNQLITILEAPTVEGLLDKAFSDSTSRVVTNVSESVGEVKKSEWSFEVEDEPRPTITAEDLQPGSVIRARARGETFEVYASASGKLYLRCSDGGSIRLSDALPFQHGFDIVKEGV